MDTRPQIPKKLPPESRRPLSLIQEYTLKKVATETSANEYNDEYTLPIEQPSSKNQHDDSNNKLNHDFHFFNENAYESNESSFDECSEKEVENKVESVYQYLSDSLSTTKDDIDKKLENFCIKEKSSDCSTPAKEDSLNISQQDKPSIPPKRPKTNSSISLKYISNNTDLEDIKDYIFPTEANVYTLGKVLIVSNPKRIFDKVILEKHYFDNSIKWD